jgi:integrase
MATHHLTDKLARGLPAPANGNRLYYDAEVKGLALRVTAAGHRSWVLNRRIRGRERRLTIGDLANWPTRLAREQARAWNRQIDLGDDPAAERETDRKAPTVADLTARYLEEAKGRKRSWSDDESMGRLEVIPKLGRIKVAHLTRGDVVDLFQGITKRAPIRANRVLSLIHTMLGKAEVWGWREGANPAAHIERNPETKRDRYVSVEELGRLLPAIAAHHNQQSANAIRLSLLTGCRRGEALGARWGEFDLTARTWHKPPSRTKQRKAHLVPLNGPATALLVAMKEAADRENELRVRDGLPPIDYVFPGRNGAGPQQDVDKAWRSICEAAGITDLRFHDLRHAFASFLVSSGHNLPLIGQLLGHSNPQTTSRYAHLLLDPQRAATEAVGSIITGAGRPSAEVMPIAGGRRA